MQMKLFRPIHETWCHHQPIDERDVIIRLHLSLFGSCYENSAIRLSILYVVSIPLLIIRV